MVKLVVMGEGPRKAGGKLVWGITKDKRRTDKRQRSSAGAGEQAAAARGAVVNELGIAGRWMT